MTVLGTAFVEILPSSVGFSQALKTQVKAASDSAAAANSGVFDKLAGVGKMAVLGIAAGAAVVGVAAVKMAGDFQSSLTKLVTGAGESEANLAMVKNGIMAMGPQVGMTAKQLSDGMFLIQSAGYHGADGLNVLKAAAEGAKVGGADLGVVGNALTTVLKDYHLPASQAAAVTSQLVQTVASGKTTMADLAASMSTVLPVAAASKVSFQQVAGAMATMTGQGITAQQSAQNVVAVIRAFANPSLVAVHAMNQLGISSTDLTQNLGTRGLSGSLELVTTQIAKSMGPSGLVLLNTFKQSKTAAADAAIEFQKLPPGLQAVAKEFEEGTITQKAWRAELKNLPVDQRQLASQFANTVNASRGFNDALKAGGPAAESLSKALTQVLGGQNGYQAALALTGANMADFKTNIAGVTAAGLAGAKQVQGFALTQKDFNFQLDQAKAVASNLGIELGDKLIPVIQHVMVVVQAVVGWFSRHTDVAKALAVVIGGVLSLAVGAYIVLMGVKFVGAVGEAGKALSAMASAGAGAADNFLHAASGFGSAVASGASKVASMASSAASAFANALKSVATYVATNVAGAATAAAAWIAANAVMLLGIGLIIVAVIGAVILIIKNWKTIEAFFVAVWDHLKAYTKAAFDFVVGIVKGAVDWIGAHWQLMLAVLIGPVGLAILFIKDHFGQIVAIVQGAIDWVTSHWQLILAVLTGPIGLAVLFVKDNFGAVQRAVSDVIDWVTSHWQLILAVITGPIGLAVLFVKDHFIEILTVVHTVVDGVANFFTALPQRIMNGIIGLASMVGAFFMTNVLTPIVGFLTTVVTWFTGLPQRIIDAVFNLGALVFNFLTGVVLPQIVNWLVTVVNWYITLPQRIVDAIFVLAQMVSNFLNINVLNPITGFLSTVVNFFAGLPGRIIGGIWRLAGDVNGFLVGAVEPVFVGWINKVVGFFASLPGRIMGGMAALGGMMEGFWTGTILPKVRAPLDAIIGGINFLVHGVNAISGLVNLPKIGDIPMMAAGGAIPHGPVGAGFVTKGIRAITGEGGPHAEFVIHTDPAHRATAVKLAADVAHKLGLMVMPGHDGMPGMGGKAGAAGMAGAAAQAGAGGMGGMAGMGGAGGKAGAGGQAGAHGAAAALFALGGFLPRVPAFEAGGVLPSVVALAGGGQVPNYANLAGVNIPGLAQQGPGTHTTNDTSFLNSLGSGIAGALNSVGGAVGDVLAAIRAGAADAILKPLFAAFNGLTSGLPAFFKAPVSSLEADILNWVKGTVTTKAGPAPSVGGGGAGPGDTSAHSASAAAAQAMARQMAPQWATGPEWAAWLAVTNRESGWSNTARNPQSGAYGIAQALGHGPSNQYPAGPANPPPYGTSDPAAQIAWMIGYIKSSYGDPIGALAHENRAGWYDGGGIVPPGPSLMLNTTGRNEQLRVITPEGAGRGSTGPVITVSSGAVQITVAAGASMDAAAMVGLKVMMEETLVEGLEQLADRATAASPGGR